MSLFVVLTFFETLVPLYVVSKEQLAALQKLVDDQSQKIELLESQLKKSEIPNGGKEDASKEDRVNATHIF